MGSFVITPRDIILIGLLVVAIIVFVLDMAGVYDKKRNKEESKVEQE